MEWASLIQCAFATTTGPQQWADLGCGQGTFTYALASLLPSGSSVYAVDAIKQVLDNPYREVSIVFQQADFEQDPLPLTGLDGILMANALHYVRDKHTVIQRLAQYCQPAHAFLIVEYDTTAANAWVPFPIDFADLDALFRRAGYGPAVRLGERKSRYGGTMYAARIDTLL